MAEAESDFAARAAKFFEFERQHALFDYSVAEFSAWRVMRHFLFNEYQGYTPSVSATPFLNRLACAVIGLLQLVLLLARPRQVDILFKGCASSMRIFEREKWIDPNIDPLLDEGFTALKLVELNNLAFAPNIANARYKVDLQPTIFGLIGRFAGIVLPVTGQTFFKRTEGLLKSELGLQVSYKKMSVRISSIIWQSRLYALLLRRCTPRAIVVTDTGEFALQSAARRLNIPFIEIQHGVFDRLHPDCIPEDINKSDSHLLIPDALLMKGNFWVDQVKGSRQASVAKSVGSYAIDQARVARSMAVTNRRGCHLLITSQGLDITNLMQWIEGMAFSITEASPNCVSIKMHPVYDCTGTFDALTKIAPNCRAIAGNELPNIYQLLAEADVHASINSASHFDALALGVPTVMLPLQNHDSLMYAVEQGYIQLLAHPAEIYQISRSAIDPTTMEHFCKSGYAANVMQVITGLTSGRQVPERSEF
jgi:hypothetical protein